MSDKKRKINAKSYWKHQEIKGCIEELEYALEWLRRYDNAQIGQNSLAKAFQYSSNKIARQIQNRFKEYLTKDAIHPFTPELLSEAIRSLELPSQKLLRDILKLDSETVYQFPDYDETIFWDEYVANVCTKTELNILKHLYEQNMTLKATGEQFGYTKQGIGNIKTRILSELRKPNRLAILFQNTDLQETCHNYLANTQKLQASLGQILEKQDQTNVPQTKKALTILRKQIDTLLTKLNQTNTAVSIDNREIANLRGTLCNRTINALLDLGYHTVQDVKNHHPTYESIREIRNIGEKSADELYHFLRKPI